MKVLRLLLASLLVCGIAVDAFADDDALKNAQQLISRRQYNEAISLLNRVIETDKGNAQAVNLLATAYHWKKDYPSAKRWYLEAARLDPKYQLSIVPLLDELKEYQEIIRLAQPELSKGTRRISLLGSLLSAYMDVGRKSDAKQVQKFIVDTQYESSYDRDYKNYILSEYFLSEGDIETSLSHLRQISDKSFLSYARTSPRFAKLLGNPDFERLTQ